MADERWTAETEELVARAIFAHVHPTGDWGSWSAEPHHDYFGDEARKVLTALADAGVLTAVGGETRQEIEVQSGRVHYPCSDLPRAWRQYGGLRAEGKPAKVVTRTVILTPWREVTDDPA